MKRPQCPQIGGMHLAVILHLERLEPEFTVDDEVDLGPPRAGSPVEEIRVLPGVRGPRAKMLGYQPFQRLPVDFLRPIGRPLGTQRAEHASVEQVYLLVRDRRTLGAFAEDRQPKGQQQILQDAHVPRGELALDLAFPGHRRDVELRAVGEADGFQKSGEGADVPRKALRPDFFIEVQVRVGVEDIRGISGAHHQGQQPDSECPVEIEFGQFRGHERMHRAVHGPASRQIHATAPEFSCAMGRKMEIWIPIFAPNATAEGSARPQCSRFRTSTEPRRWHAHARCQTTDWIKMLVPSTPSGMIPMKDVVTLEEAVWVDPDRMSGAPCFRGSRLPVQQLFDWLADGVPLDEFVEEFRIDRRAAEAVLRAAGARFSDRNVETTAEEQSTAGA